MKRRAILLGGGAVLATAVGGAVAWKLRLFGPHYPPTPYDDVLNRLDDREWARKFGARAVKTMPEASADATAARLRSLLGSGTLQQAAARDAEESRLAEADGWLVPESVAQMAVLAAKTN